MKILRLENTNFGFSSFLDDEVDRVVEFDSEFGGLKIHILESPRQIFFGDTQKSHALIKELLHEDLNFDDTSLRIIHNPPIQNAYSAPFKIYIDITLACSLQCPFCLSGSGQEMKSSLSIDVIQKIATEIRDLGIMYVKIGGGDPFLHPNFKEIVALLRSIGCFITISTNSTTVTPEIAKLLAENNVRTSVSIEGMEITNDSMRGTGHFQKVLSALEILKNVEVDTILRTTLLRQNLGEVPNLVALAKSRGVKIKFSYCRPAGRAVHNQTMLGPQDAIDYLKVLEYLNSPEVLPHVLMDEGMMFNQPTEVVQKLLRGRMCGAANRSMHIDADRKVSPCVFLGPTFSFGKVYQDGTINDFWRENIGNKFKTVRAIRQSNECDNCHRICKNECPANRFYLWGNFDQQDSNCLCEAMRNRETQLNTQRGGK